MAIGCFDRNCHLIVDCMPTGLETLANRIYAPIRSDGLSRYHVLVQLDDRHALTKQVGALYYPHRHGVQQATSGKRRSCHRMLRRLLTVVIRPWAGPSWVSARDWGGPRSACPEG